MLNLLRCFMARSFLPLPGMFDPADYSNTFCPTWGVQSIYKNIQRIFYACTSARLHWFSTTTSYCTIWLWSSSYHF